MNLIAAVDRNWAIGKEGRLLVSIPADQQMFREETKGKVVIMGRKTLESLPGGQPLHKRTNIILSRNPQYKVKGATVCGSVEEVLDAVKDYPAEDVFVIGGQEIYRQFLPYCDTAHITYIDYAYQADTFLQNLDRDPDWKMELESDELTYFNLCYTFRRYVRNRKSSYKGENIDEFYRKEESNEAARTPDSVCDHGGGDCRGTAHVCSCHIKAADGTGEKGRPEGIG